MAEITLRQANINDLAAIMTIINGAKAQLRAAGSPQWQDGYPNANTIGSDIAAGVVHLLTVDGQVAGTVSLITAVEPTYATVEGGNWAKPDAPYATIHRIAISADFAGQHLGHVFMQQIADYARAHNIYNLRLDTHRLNQAMQRVATAAGFKLRGTIYITHGEDRARLAYELNL
jgi:GNAT superfamily N-acetyltransferase